MRIKCIPRPTRNEIAQRFYISGGFVCCFHETKTKALPARVDASTRIASVARGRQTRAVIKEIWRQADVLADDELRADAAAKAALAAEEARRPKPLPPPPPPLETMLFGARYAVLGLGHVLRKVGERAAQATKGRSDDPLRKQKPSPCRSWAGRAPTRPSTTRRAPTCCISSSGLWRTTSRAQSILLSTTRKTPGGAHR